MTWRMLVAATLVALGALVTSAGCGSSSSGDTGAVGDACKADTDCESGMCEVSDPGGQCVALCTKQADCPSGSTCTDEKKCYKSCTSASDCTRSGYACVDAMTVDQMATKTCDIAGG